MRRRGALDGQWVQDAGQVLGLVGANVPTWPGWCLCAQRHSAWWPCQIRCRRGRMPRCTELWLSCAWSLCETLGHPARGGAPHSFCATASRTAAPSRTRGPGASTSARPWPSLRSERMMRCTIFRAARRSAVPPRQHSTAQHSTAQGSCSSQARWCTSQAQAAGQQPTSPPLAAGHTADAACGGACLQCRCEPGARPAGRPHPPGGSPSRPPACAPAQQPRVGSLQVLPAALR